MKYLQRHVPFERVHNFRDLGGYETVDGRTVAWGSLFRSAQLSEMTSDDMTRFEALGVDLVCDFRRDDERARDPTPVTGASTEVVELAITPGSSEVVWRELADGRASPQEMVSLMESINRDLVLNQVGVYRQLFGLMLQGPRRLLVHCAAGKDRTGIAAALILSALGVDRQTVMEDYLLTNQYLPIESEIDRIVTRLDRAGGKAPERDILRPVMEARESYLGTALNTIDEQFGSLATYFRAQLGLDEPELLQLRAWYLAEA